MLIEETVYLNRNNDIALRLSSDGATITHTALTRCQVLVGDTNLIDSQVTPTLFDLTYADKLTLKFGASSLTPGRYTAKLYVFDDAHPLGLFWGEFVLQVKA